MPTQTGSIDFTSTGGFKSYATNKYATQSTVSDMQTAISQNADAIALRATKTEAYQVAQPNLSPYFSMPMTQQSDDYWANLTYARFTQHEDGWAHFEYTNTGSSTVNSYIGPKAISTLLPGGNYTLLAEFRNVAISGATNGNFYSQQISDAQIWGADAYGGFSITNAQLIALENGEGKFYKSLTLLDAESKDPSGTVRGTLPKTIFMTINQQVAGGQSVSYDLRISLYEGEYTGPYKPYSGTQLYASQAELKVQSDRIGMVVSNADASSSLQLTPAAITAVTDNLTIKDSSGSATVISGGRIQANSLTIGDMSADTQADILNSNMPQYRVVTTSYSYTLAQWLTYAAEGYTSSWATGTYGQGVRAGDTVMLKGTNSDNGSAVYVLMTVNTLNTSGAIANATSHGLIDPTAGQRADLIQVGGRNLLAWSDRKGATNTSVSGLSWTHDADGWITVTGTINSSSAGVLLFWGTNTATNYVYPAGTYTVTVENDGLLAANVLRVQFKHDNNTNKYLYDSGSLTFTAENGISRVCLYRYGANGTAVNGRIRFKMERGNKATDWTPAPEDVESSIIEASKTASNYITADSTGIKIHMSGSTSTYQHQSSTATTYYVNGNKRAEVGTSGLKVYVGTTGSESSVAEFGTTARVGSASGPNVYVESGGVSVRDGTTGVVKFTGSAESGYYTRSSSVELAGWNGTALKMMGSASTNDRFIGLESGFNASMSVTNTDSLTDYGSFDGHGFINMNADGLSVNGTTVDMDKQVLPAFLTQSGMVSQSISASANAVTSHTVTFPIPYEVSPIVTACFYSTSTAAAFGGLSLSVSAITTTSFTVKIFNNTGTGRTVGIFWIAAPQTTLT